MPVRSLSSHVLRWPDAHEVDQALRLWVTRAVESGRGMLRVGYFGSYARGDWGPGSDLDIIIVVEGSDQLFESRTARWDTTGLPVPADVLVYTKDEWDRLGRTSAFHEMVMREAVWVYGRGADAGSVANP